MTQDRLKRWHEWLSAEGLFKDIATLHHNRRVFNGLRAVAGNNDAVGSSLIWEWAVHNYVVAQAVGVRRQTATREGERTIARLLLELQQHPELVTRQARADAARAATPADDWAKESEADRAAREFEEHYGGDVLEHLDPALPGADLARLLFAARPIRNHVNKHFAHADEKAKEPTATFEELNAAIDLLGEIYIKYSSMLRHTSWIGQVSAELPDNWDAVLRDPWIDAPDADE